MNLDSLKEQAAQRALDEVRSGMKLGLGTGSTVAWFLDHLGRALKEGRVKDIAGVPTSDWTEGRCHALGIPVISLDDHDRLDLGVDGADEVTPELHLIKGLGGALLREKMVAFTCDRFIVIADSSKEVARLGERSPLPVEVIRFAWRSHLTPLRRLGLEPVLREDERGPEITDNGNYILDCQLPVEGGFSPYDLDLALRERPGIVETGFFLDVADEALIARPDGVVSLRRG
jgi:ribose 5-phosphate isomerase A